MLEGFAHEVKAKSYVFLCTVEYVIIDSMYNTEAGI